jgi:hypothetical protein
MRRLIVAAAAAVTLVAASSLGGGRAEALPLPGAAGLGTAAQSGLTHEVRYVCHRVWNGWRWVRSCHWARPRVHWHHHHHHYRPWRHHRRHHHHHRRHFY